LREKGIEILYSIADPNWNVIAICDQTGNIQERYTYDAFGKQNIFDTNFTTRTGTDFNWNRTFTGQVLDFETELMLYRSRFYHIGLGRFVNRDLIGYSADYVSLYRYIGNLCTTGNDAMGLAGQQCSIHMFYGDNSEIWDMMYETGLLKTKKPTDQDNYPAPNKDDWNIPDNTWINPYFCWESRFCSGVDSNRIVRPKEKLTNDMRAHDDTLQTLREGGLANTHKVRELCRQKTCCSVTIYMHCGREFLKVLKPYTNGKKGNIADQKLAKKIVNNHCKQPQTFYCDKLKW
jgi:RHS repeat-associated protein